ncbi:MAG: outer membrane receptor for ferrienterochelin and colicins [Alteromonadaceae bacterium]|jgi:outer membrane receptor for ferrienterochelin and colicins
MKELLMRIVSWFSLLFIFVADCCFADDYSSDIERIVISGTRTAKLLSDSAVDVNVIDGDVLAKISQGTLAQALNFIPGVVITRSVKEGYNIQMQGFDSDHVLVLLDSQPLVSPSGSSVDLDQINANNIEQIEVLRGAASVLYGSSAMGGVINIITKKDRESGMKISYELANYQGNEIAGDEVSHLAKVNASSTLWGWQTNADLLIIDDAGFDYNPETVMQDAANLDKKFAKLSASRRFYNIDTQLSYQFFKEDKDRPTAIIPGQQTVISYLSDVEQQQFTVGITGEQQMWKINSRYIKHDESSGQSNSTRKTEISLAEIDGQNVWTLGKNEIVAGFVLHQDKLDQIKPTGKVLEVDDESRESIESYLQANWNIAQHQVLAGVRMQHDSDFGWHHAMRLSGLVNLSTAPNQLQWRMGVGESYRVPNLKERFYTFDHSNLGYMVLGNENLLPETATSFNSSITYNTSIWQNDADLVVHVNAHYSDTDNIIETVIDAKQSANTGLSIYSYENIANAKISGFDASIDIALNQWRYQLNYSYLDSENDRGQRLTARPRHQIKSNIQYSFEQQDIDIIAYLVYQADEAIPNDYLSEDVNDSLLVNVTLNQAITHSLSWRLGVDNIFDEHKGNNATAKRAFDVRPISSRRIYAGISYQF